MSTGICHTKDVPVCARMCVCVFVYVVDVYQNGTVQCKIEIDSIEQWTANTQKKSLCCFAKFYKQVCVRERVGF